MKEAGIDNGFNPFDGNLYFVREELTFFELLHEMKHAEEFKLIKSDEYIKDMNLEGGLLDAARTYKREKYVYDELMEFKDMFTDAQIEYAEDYIMKVHSKLEAERKNRQ